jgi:hypothetical protein
VRHVDAIVDALRDKKNADTDVDVNDGADDCAI